jgi:uncharacterized YigZ family protein
MVNEMMEALDVYTTIENPVDGMFKDKGSKFIAYAYPLSNELVFKEILQEVKLLHPKARHHCWAYRLTNDRQVFKLSDDGEPAGSAGRPILNTLLSANLTHVAVIVVRYFGGTLLGVPGLINAYKEATKEALSAAHLIQKTVNDQFVLVFGYLQLNDMMRIVKDLQLEVLDQQFDNTCRMEISCRQAQTPQLIQRLQQLDSIEITPLNET